MQYEFTKTFSSAPEAGGDDITRNRFLKEHYELNIVDPETPAGMHTYPEKIYDTPEKAALALHCMCSVMRSDPICMENKLLKSLATEIEIYSFAQSNELRQKFLQNIMIVMGSIIETSKEAPMIVEAMDILEDMKSMSELEGFVLPIHGKKFHAANSEYQKNKL